jgi:type II secretory pathway component PulF
LQTPDKAGSGYVFREYELPMIKAGERSGRITSFTEEVIGSGGKAP